MQRGWLWFVLVAMVLAISAAPALAEKVNDPEHAADKKADHKDDKAKHEEGIFKGFLDLTIWTIVVFLVLFFVLAKFAWKPMLEGLKQRETAIHSAMEEAKSAKEEAIKLRAELQAEIAKARSEAQAVRDEARRDAERMREEMNAQTKAEIQKQRDSLRKENEDARKQLIKEVEAHVAALSTMVASKAVRRQITIEDQNRLVDEALAELRGAADERQQVVASIQ